MCERRSVTAHRPRLTHIMVCDAAQPDGAISHTAQRMREEQDSHESDASSSGAEVRRARLERYAQEPPPYGERSS